ncbi:hypothetical protein B0O99DRAFT_588996 [Bisporella sp. PMI_857]|nr:hypothetical protein B0O99DRAFT_588996 [Bisporella sp. PMI_857]
MSINKTTSAGKSRLERLPPELLRKILIFVTLPDDSHIRSNKLLIPLEDSNHNNKVPKPALTSLPCLLTSRSMFAATLPVMYRDITTSSPSTFSKFLAQLRCYPSLGNLIRTLDLAPVSKAIQFEDEKLANPIPELLRLTPLLREFKTRLGFQQYLDQSVLNTLFSELPYLYSIDIEGCNSPTFAINFAHLCNSPDFHVSSSITSLNLSGCSDLPPLIFSTALPQLPRLATLDVEQTQITAEGLGSIPQTARLTHLNVNNCHLLSGDGLASFLSANPAANTSLISLQAETNPEIQPLLEEDVSRILASAPSTLRVLHLKNPYMTSKHLPYLQILCRQLEELKVGSQLSMLDIESLYLTPEAVAETWRTGALEEVDVMRMDSKYNIVLDPMAEAVAVCRLRRRLDSTEALYIAKQPTLQYLDVSSLSTVEQGKIRTSVLLGLHAGALQVIEISERVLRRYGILKKLCKAVGWVMKSAGKRCWLLKNFEREDNSRRIWRSVW